MSEQGFRGVPGVPEGWELVRIDHVTKGEWYSMNGKANEWSSVVRSDCDFPVIRKIETPKKYRPFANGEEFKPHRDRWWKPKTFSPNIDPDDLLIHPPQAYNRDGFSGCTWVQAFNGRIFDDGTPFGVEVAE